MLTRLALFVETFHCVLTLTAVSPVSVSKATTRPPTPTEIAKVLFPLRVLILSFNFDYLLKISMSALGQRRFVAATPSAQMSPRTILASAHKASNLWTILKLTAPVRFSPCTTHFPKKHGICTLQLFQVFSSCQKVLYVFLRY